jgi:hypothetical protein
MELLAVAAADLFALQVSCNMFQGIKLYAAQVPSQRTAAAMWLPAAATVK